MINFPEISSEKLIKEIKKEMRLPNEGYIKLLFDKDRVRFFNNEIDENWSGNIVATTASPDQSKASLPGGRLCMVMGLGPKGLPKSFINKAAYHFELTGWPETKVVVRFWIIGLLLALFSLTTFKIR